MLNIFINYKSIAYLKKFFYNKCMRRKNSKIYILTCLFVLLLPTFVYAKDITNNSIILINEKENIKIKDNNENTHITIEKGTTISIKNIENIYGIYIIYELKSKPGVIRNKEQTISIGTNGFLHEYVNIEKEIGAVKDITLEYQEKVKIADIYVLGEGDLPEFVEVWNSPCQKADLLLFSTHSDDEQLFFLGLLPTYVAKNKKVQVVYFTNHYDNPKRLHEQLHGLYTVGIKNYPVIGIIPDAYSTTLEGALANMKKTKIEEEDAIFFEVEMLRRFKPFVVVGHDELGEYSHGQHILNTHILKQAIEKANDNTYHIQSIQEYGVWDVPKTYLHLYNKNQIIMDYDIPLEYFNGRTAYEVSKEGYKKHISQQYTWFTSWMNGKNNEYTQSTEIKIYSPREFGLYRSLVGEDTEKNDMFENIVEKKQESPKRQETLNKENQSQIDSEETIRKKDKKIECIRDIIITSLLLGIGIKYINKKGEQNG